MKKPTIGKMDRKITIQRATTANDSFNEPIPTWSDLTRVWAKYEPVKDVERLASSEVASAITARFTIRHSSTVENVDTMDRYF